MVSALLDHAWKAGLDAIQILLIPTPFFVVLAFIVKGRRLAKDVIRAANESRINILMHFTDMLIVAPCIAILAVALKIFFHGFALTGFAASLWKHLPAIVLGFIAVFLADFIGYWRHRIEHTQLLWPSHSVHHSDTELTWLAILRFHPFNRFTTYLIDMGFLLILGLPISALIVAVTVKHYYGAFIHADLPWTFGPLRYVFVSPTMHRWHHAEDKAAYNTNFATIFSIFDLAFGTYRVPRTCDVPLGVSERRTHGFFSEMVHPLKPSSYRALFTRPEKNRSRLRFLREATAIEVGQEVKQ